MSVSFSSHILVSSELSVCSSSDVVLPPAGVFHISAEEAFLSAIINYTNSSTVHFKLSPAYVLYAVGRHALQRHHGPSCLQTGHTHSVTLITNRMVDMTRNVIQASQCKPFVIK